MPQAIRVNQQSQVLTETAFNELLTCSISNVINIKPTWGVSVLRDDTSATTGTGAAVDEINGEIRLQTGTAASNVASIRTLQRGQYRAGMTGEVGVGVRIPTLPTGQQDAQWGYFDASNGVGFGVDAAGVYVFYTTDGVTTKTYQSSWSVDRLDGSGNTNPSLQTLSLSQGNIFQVELLWYGYGTLRFYVVATINGVKTKTEVHRINITGSVSIVDPNQPIAVRAINGTSTSNFIVYVGGRQFSLIGGDVKPQIRPVSELISGFTITAAINVWQPLIAIRRKATFGPSGRTNSVRCIWTGSQVLADNPCEFRVTTGALTGGTPAGWSTPTDWTSSESAVETKVQTGSLTASGTNYTVNRGMIGASGTRTSTLVTAEGSIPLGSAGESILWVRRTTASTTVVSAVMEWEEQW